MFLQENLLNLVIIHVYQKTEVAKLVREACVWSSFSGSVTKQLSPIEYQYHLLEEKGILVLLK